MTRLIDTIIYCEECRFFDEDFNVCKLPHGLSFSYLKKNDYCSYARERIKMSREEIMDDLQEPQEEDREWEMLVNELREYYKHRKEVIFRLVEKLKE